MICVTFEFGLLIPLGSHEFLANFRQDQVLQWLSVLSGIVALVCLVPAIP